MVDHDHLDELGHVHQLQQVHVAEFVHLSLCVVRFRVWVLCLAVWCVAWSYLERVVGWFFVGGVRGFGLFLDHASVWCVLGFGCFVWLYVVLCRPACGRHC